MGRMWLRGMLDESDSKGRFSEPNYSNMLEIHLQYNHFPPVSSDFVPACKRAIKNCSLGKFDKIVLLPNGKRRASSVICDGLHLWEWVEDESEPEYADDTEEAIMTAEGKMK